MKKLRMEIVGMSYSESQSGAYALILGVVGTEKRLPIIIGGFEAQAIAIELEKMKPTRPLTHDLFKNFSNHYGINLVEVVINKFEEGIFFSKLICEKDGEISEIDSRTSDAIALSLRFGCPVYAYEPIVDEAGIEIEEKKEDDEDKIEKKEEDSESFHEGDTGYEEYLLEELEEMLQKAIGEENYEEASRLRDEIKRRKKKS